MKTKLVWLLALATGLASLSWTSGAPTPKSLSNSPPDVTLNVQTKKLASLVDERFLSMTVDPEQLIRHAEPGPGALRLLSMVAAMSPAYLRVAGSSTEHMGFEGRPGHDKDTVSVNDEHWSHLQQLCRTAGLRAIIALSGRRRPGESRWDARDALRILDGVDAADATPEAPAGWQLGYDWETLRKAGVSPSQAAADVNTLKALLEEFPTLAKEAQILLGPDADATVADGDSVGEFAKAAHVGAVVIRPFTTEDPTGAKIDRDFMNKVLGRNTKRQLWIAESGEMCTAPFSSALLWAQRLATATRLGAQLIFRELDLDAARETATPDFWVSLLHKTLTSRGVLDARRSGSASDDLSTSAYCTPSGKEHQLPKSSPISKAIRYDLGAVTIMAANPTNRNLRLNLEIASGNGLGSLVGASEDVGTVVHEYVLTAPNNDLNSTSTLLNGSPLNLAPGASIPVLSPRLLKLDGSMAVSVPPQSVAFWVVPGAKAKACLTPPASSDVAPAASRLRPVSARGTEIGVHLDDHSPIPAESDHGQDEEEAHEPHSEETQETPVTKDLRLRRQRIAARPNGIPRLSLARVSSLPRRGNLDFNFGRPAKDPEVKTLDDYIREELRRRPGRGRASEPLKLPSLSLPTPALPQLEIPPLPSIPSIDPSSVLDPVKLNSNLVKMNSDLQKNIVEQAKAPMHNLVKITDGILDQIQSTSGVGRQKRSSDDFDVDVNPETRFLDMDDDDLLRTKRKTVIDYMNEDLKRKHKKAASEQDGKKQRRKREIPRFRRFAPDDIGLRLKRRPAVPDFVSLPRLPKRPLLPIGAKRAHLLISQNNEEGTPANSWGPNHREMFPEGDVFAGAEPGPDARNPDVDYVMDDDIPEPYLTNQATKSAQPIPTGDALLYAPGEYFETYGGQQRTAPRAISSAPLGEFGELEHLRGQPSTFVNPQRAAAGVLPRTAYSSGTIAATFDDTEADGFRVVPAANVNRDQEVAIQSELRKRLEEHYADVQRAALDQKAEDENVEDEVAEETMDMDSLKALAERYRQEKKLNLPEEKAGNSKRIHKQPGPKETEKTPTEKSRRRRDVEGVLEAALPTEEEKVEPPETVTEEVTNTPEVIDTPEVTESKGLPIIKASAESLEPSEPLNPAEEKKKKRLEKIQAFRKVMEMRKGRPLLNFKEKLPETNRQKRDAPPEDSFPIEGILREVMKQIEREEAAFHPDSWDSTGANLVFSKIPEPHRDELWPFSHFSGSFSGLPDGNHRRPVVIQEFSSKRPPIFIPDDLPPFLRPDTSPSRPEYLPFSPFRPAHNPNHRFGPRPTQGSDSSSLEISSEETSSSEAHSGHKHKLYFLPKSAFDFDPGFDLPDSVDIEDFSIEVRAELSDDPQSHLSPDIIAIPWDTTFPSNTRFKRSDDTATSNAIVQTDSTTKSHAEIAEAIRQLHKILNEDSLSSEETSVEVNPERQLIDGPETIDSLEDTIEMLLNMTKTLNATMNQNNGQELVSWSEFGMNDTKPAEPSLDPEEQKFRDAAVAWIRAKTSGAMDGPRTERPLDDPFHHLSVKKDLLEGGAEASAATELERQRKLSEQENIVTAMMQRVTVLLSQLRTILNTNQAEKEGSRKDNP